MCIKNPNNLQKPAETSHSNMLICFNKLISIIYANNIQFFLKLWYIWLNSVINKELKRTAFHSNRFLFVTSSNAIKWITLYIYFEGHCMFINETVYAQFLQLLENTHPACLLVEFAAIMCKQAESGWSLDVVPSLCVLHVYTIGNVCKVGEACVSTCVVCHTH